MTTKEDVLQVAKGLHMNPTEEQIQYCIDGFDGMAEDDPTGDWTLWIEALLYEQDDVEQNVPPKPKNPKRLPTDEDQPLIDEVIEQVKKDVADKNKDMNKVEYITEQINSTKVSGKFVPEAKQKLIEHYCVTNEYRINELDVDKIKAYDFQWEIKTGAMRLKKRKEIKKIVTKLERHAYAPEMNCLHFKSGKTYRLRGQDTMEDALTYASLHMDEREIELYKHDFMRHFRN